MRPIQRPGPGPADRPASIPARFAAVAAAHPGKPALAGPDGTLCYAGLARRAHRFAHAILAARGPGEEPIALLLPPGADAIAAVLGALAAGKIYVPLDPHAPAAYQACMLADSGAPLVLTTAGTPVPRGPARLDLDALPPGPDHDPALPLAPDRPAHILYTSGTTGTPKGVLQSHQNLLFEVGRVVRAFPVSPADRLALLHPIAAAASLRRIFPALLTGASLHLYDLKTRGLAGLPAWFEAEAITIANGRRLLRDCADALAARPPLPALRLVTFGGEPVYPRDVELYRRLTAPHCRMLVNLCTTETGSDRHFFLDKATPLAGPLVPVGYPTGGTEIRILDEAGRRLPPGATGEIATVGRHLALGYWNDPALTAARFRPDPEGSDARLYLSGDLGRLDPDGCLWFLGRKDRQLKVRGHRVEALEVEGALLALGDFADCAVAALGIPRLLGGKPASAAGGAGSRTPGQRRRTYDPCEKRLVAFVVPAAGPEPDLARVRDRLAERLPAAALPSVYVRMEALPRGPGGKVDQAALEAHFLGRRPWSDRQDLAVPMIPPRDAVEAELAGIWREELDMAELGVHDSFLELGGDSLMALAIQARVKVRFGVELALAQLFEVPTVAGLAARLAGRAAGGIP